MGSHAQLTLAVAGSRKTQGIVEECASAPADSRILILTYTTNNQNELASRIASYAGDHHNIDIQGWFSFLIKHIARPYLPFAFPGRKLRGFDFNTPPQQFKVTTSATRYLSSDGKAYRVHLPQLAFYVHTKCNGVWLDRLSRLYDVIYIDEVQDLCGYDLEILNVLISSGLNIKMVGDIRQAVIATNSQEKKNKKYMYMGVWDWFRNLEKQGSISIIQRCETWRCRQEIADFADALFDPSWKFEPTISLNKTVSDHDGIYFIVKRDLSTYVDRYNPLLLRHSANSGKNLPFEFMNYKASKGLSVSRVCILPTLPIAQYLRGRGTLTPQQSAELYVAVTRAEQSVCFIVDDDETSQIAFWKPV